MSLCRWGIVATLLAAVGSPAWSAEVRKPNVIVMLSDDLGYGELGCQGNKEIPTPNIDSIAKNGIRFTQGYVSGPYCSPTRAGLLTGRYQTRFGHEWNGRGPNFGLPLTEKTIANRFKDLGYATAAVGKWHLGDTQQYLPTRRGFDEFYGTAANTPFFHPILIDTRVSDEGRRVEEEDFYATDAWAERSVEFIEKNREKPFFLYLPFNAQHAPLQATTKYMERFSHIDDEKRRTFAAMLSAMDDATGRVLDTLRKHDLEENTIVFWLADNGGPTQSTTSKNDPLRGFKATTLEGGVRVPFMVQWKGQLPAGKTYDRPVIQLDILTTALAAAGSEASKEWKLDGVNLLPYLKGERSDDPHQTLYWKFGPQWAIRHGDWKLVRSRIDGEQPRLFNLSKDIGEANDLAAAEPEKARELKALWDSWSEEQEPARWMPPDNRKKGAAKGKGAGKKKGKKKAPSA